MRLTVSRDQLESLAARVPPRAAKSSGQTLVLEDWLRDHGLAPNGPKEWRGGRLYVFEECPWNSAHTDRSAYVIQHASGALDAGCHHDGCQGKDWHSLRDLLEPNWRQQTKDWDAAPRRPAVEKPVPALDPSVASVASVAGRKHVATAPEHLEPEALYGLPGEIVRAIEPHTESHPAALLTSFLTGAGCLLGRGPHVFRDGNRHAPNEFAVLVGLSGVSRKGTAGRRIDEIFRAAEGSGIDKWLKYTTNNNKTILSTCHGLGSGEALVASLCDLEEEADRNLLVKEEEFSRALKVMRREGSTLSENLRTAWDSGILASRTKGKRMEVRDAHVGVMAHITEDELRRELGAAAYFNGFANRFLWMSVSRVRLLPFGGGKPPTASLVSQFRESLVFARKERSVEFDAEASWMWDQGGLYKMLTTPPPGLLGAVTSRADSHVTRIALQYCLFDLEPEIRVPHLMAALAVWEHCRRTCIYLFGSSTGDDHADRIEELLREVHPGYITRREIRDSFQRHAPAGSIEKGLRLLEGLGRAECSSVKTEGRSAEAWTLKQFATCDRSDRSDRSPLQHARNLLNEGTEVGE
jgi:hypothetical protein